MAALGVAALAAGVAVCADLDARAEQTRTGGGPGAEAGPSPAEAAPNGLERLWSEVRKWLAEANLTYQNRIANPLRTSPPEQEPPPAKPASTSGESVAVGDQPDSGSAAVAPIAKEPDMGGGSIAGSADTKARRDEPKKDEDGQRAAEATADGERRAAEALEAEAARQTAEAEKDAERRMIEEAEQSAADALDTAKARLDDERRTEEARAAEAKRMEEARGAVELARDAEARLAEKSEAPAKVARAASAEKAKLAAARTPSGRPTPRSRSSAIPARLKTVPTRASPAKIARGQERARTRRVARLPAARVRVAGFRPGAKAVRQLARAGARPDRTAGIYVVKRGDTLTRIAWMHYRSASRYSEVHRANRSKIKDPNLIYPGQRLRIPRAWREGRGSSV